MPRPQESPEHIVGQVPKNNEAPRTMKKIHQIELKNTKCECEVRVSGCSLVRGATQRIKVFLLRTPCSCKGTLWDLMWFVWTGLLARLVATCHPNSFCSGLEVKPICFCFLWVSIFNICFFLKATMNKRNRKENILNSNFRAIVFTLRVCPTFQKMMYLLISERNTGDSGYKRKKMYLRSPYLTVHFLKYVCCMLRYLNIEHRYFAHRLQQRHVNKLIILILRFS